ncbi:hypothetical protein DM01DRAFT_316836 [Hesseltinella vesiculosa]|uniref:C2H2-type domain-containing protein n=1 Tax=Hesseltinella vesiculosa TaxID=101127 RepID=A0A1X2GIR3_9FUNG|nr:hypothetical protein DM01DRAFT_316836 [Hesseltinella vesiculosa]
MLSNLFTPTKIPFSDKNDYFKQGTIALRAYWLQHEHTEDMEIIQQEAQNLTSSISQTPIFCELSSCVKHNHYQPLAFPNLVAFELHDETYHRHICSECHRTFPSDRWLRLHCDELHNFACFVETCDKHFITPKMRRLHLIDKHQYPKFFPFRIVVTGTRSYEERQERIRLHHAQKTGGSPSSADATHNPPPSKDTMDVDDLTDRLSKIKIPSSISFGRGKAVAWHGRSRSRLANMDTHPL